MISPHAKDAYCQNQTQAHARSRQIVHMMLEKTLCHLDLVKEGLKDNNKNKQNKHLAKTIAIITELNSSVKMTDTSEAARFLHRIYGSILTELPKVVRESDTRTLKKIQGYLERLKGIWGEKTIFEGCKNLEIETNRWRF